eukprot:gb/GECH01000891.1/.p1 GENE.gb/GECH01000891.1/~~gb/GECH01000891.1/.p1  ORF type:complete len:120 (+),score=33.22 gb/GECH01000891.1/:1-360(+)
MMHLVPDELPGETQHTVGGYGNGARGMGACMGEGCWGGDVLTDAGGDVDVGPGQYVVPVHAVDDVANDAFGDGTTTGDLYGGDAALETDLTDRGKMDEGENDISDIIEMDIYDFNKYIF